MFWSFVLRFQIIASAGKPTRWTSLKGNFYKPTSEKNQNPGDLYLLWGSCLHTWEDNRKLSQEFKADCEVFAKNPRQREIGEGSTGSPERLAAHIPAWAPTLLSTHKSASHALWSVPFFSTVLRFSF